MQTVRPAQTNLIVLSVVHRGTGQAVETGTVQFRVMAVSGPNKGKWWNDATGAWSATAVTAGDAEHKDEALWALDLPSDSAKAGTLWVAEQRYTVYPIESGGLEVAGAEEVHCEVPLGGAGAREGTFTVLQGATPIEGAAVWVTNDVTGVDGGVTIAGPQATNATGQCRFSLDDGSYWVHVQAGGYSFSVTYPKRLTVSSAGFSFTEIQVDGVVSAPSIGTIAWTVDGLCRQLMGELNLDRNATGGAVPTRLENIVLLTRNGVWTAGDWKFRQKWGEFTTVAGSPTYRLSHELSEFDKFEQTWLEESNRKGLLFFTEDLGQWEGARAFFGTTPGWPRLALIEVDTDLPANVYGVRLRFAPTPNGSYTYRHCYLTRAPAIANNAAVAWPDWANDLWYWYAKAAAFQAFKEGQEWQPMAAYAKSLLDRAAAKNDEHLTSSTPARRDGYGDLAALGME